MSTTSSPRKRKGLLAALVIVTAALTVGIVALLVNIFTHKQEAKEPFFKVVALDDTIDDPAVWGKNFPLQYDMYKKTADQERTRYGGSEALPQTPTQLDPRSVVAQSKIHEDPRLVTMWKGYAFATDFREERGHAYMLVDQRDTKRVTEFKQPGACLNCHASTYVLMKKLGNGDTKAGFDAMNKMTYAEATKQVNHPVACIDCHDPETMALRITRPGFIEGIKAANAAEGIADYDVNRDATAQEMRSFVCGQCHVEYYFKGEGKTLTFPWSKGLKVENEYAAQAEHKDWTHKLTGANVIKAQHPEFEMWSQGVHAKSGVTCADCHMPYVREGGAKVSDHQVRSPMLNVNNSCQVCHRTAEADIKARVDDIQNRFIHTRNVTFDALVEFIGEIEAAQASGVDQARIDVAKTWQRRAQFYLDYVEAENSTGFHAPGEALRILNDSTDCIRKGQLALAGKPIEADPEGAIAFKVFPAPTPAPSPSASPSPSK